MTQIDDASGLVPVRGNSPWEVDEHGRVALRRRKFGRMGTLLMRLFRMSPDLTVRLDPLGSAVWQLIDDRRTAQEILERLHAKFPQEENLGRRLGQYLSTLASSGFIRLQ